jgi:5-methyltetrahydropteroyltriglutamate--homocysteine methyltransferase
MHLMHPNNAVDLRASQQGAAVERVFQTIPADRIILPLDAANKDFDLLRLVPKGKLVVLGLISATRPSVESADDVMAWIDEAAKRIDGDGLALSPASGFAATAAAGTAMSEADQKRKLELVADVATRWWGFAM